MTRSAPHVAISIAVVAIATLLAASVFLSISATHVRAGSGTTIPVTSTVDSLAPDGECSLREAVIAANTNVAVDACPAGSAIEADNIALLDPAAEYELSTPGAGEDAAAAGDLDVLGSLHVCCAGTIDANGIDRIFDVHPGVESFAIQVTALLGGNAGDENGGAIRAIGGCGKGSFFSTRLGVDYTLIQGNMAANGGALAIGPCVDAAAQGPSLVGNGAISNGGGILVEPDGSLRLVIATVAQNAAGSSGGGIHAEVTAQTVTIVSTTISENEAPVGGGLVMIGTPGIDNNIIDTIIANNLEADCAISVPIGGGWNIAGDDSCGTLGPNSMTETDPLLAPLASEAPAFLVYRPLPGSPAIDTGTPVDPPSDQVGRDRPIDGDVDGVAAFDIGAIEAIAPAPEGPGSGGITTPTPSATALPDTSTGTGSPAVGLPPMLLGLVTVAAAGGVLAGRLAVRRME